MGVRFYIESENASTEDLGIWTALKFHGPLSQECQQQLGYATLLRYLKEHEVVHWYPRKWPERQDEEKRAEFLEELKELHSNPNNTLWFGDEIGFEGDPRPRRTWVTKGSKPRTPYLSVAPLRDAAPFLCERSLSSLRGL